MSSIVSSESVLSTPAEAAGEEQVAERGINTGIPRWVDVSMAIIGLIIAAPVIGVLGLGIAMTSGLPIFFRQKRVGRHGSQFNLVKSCLRYGTFCEATWRWWARGLRSRVMWS